MGDSLYMDMVRLHAKIREGKASGPTSKEEAPKHDVPVVPPRSAAERMWESDDIVETICAFMGYRTAAVAMRLDKRVFKMAVVLLYEIRDYAELMETLKITNDQVSRCPGDDVRLLEACGLRLVGWATWSIMCTSWSSNMISEERVQAE